MTAFSLPRTIRLGRLLWVRLRIECLTSVILCDGTVKGIMNSVHCLGCIITIIILCSIGVAALCYHHKHVRHPDDEVDLVGNMDPETPQLAAPNPNNAPKPALEENTDVQFVIPKQPLMKRESHELTVFVSTTDGLKTVERKPSSSSR